MPIIVYSGEVLTFPIAPSTLKIAKCADLACTSAGLSEIDPGIAAFTSGPSVTIGFNGFPFISFGRRQVAGQPFTLTLMRCMDHACRVNNIVIATTESNLLHNTSIAIGADGIPVVSYGVSGPSVKFVRCNARECGTGIEPAIFVVENTFPTPQGGQNSITIGNNGAPVIAYTVANGIQLVICRLPACTGVNALRFITSNAEVSDPQVSIGVDGLPIIAYLNVSNPNDRRLMLVKCGGQDCAVMTSVSVDPTGRVLPRGVSVAIGADGLPVMAYADAIGQLPTNKEAVKVAKCGSSQCVPYWTRR